MRITYLDVTSVESGFERIYFSLFIVSYMRKDTEGYGRIRKDTEDGRIRKNTEEHGRIRKNTEGIEKEEYGRKNTEDDGRIQE